MKRDADEDEDEDEEDADQEVDLAVHAPFYPKKKDEAWWVVIGEESTKTLLAVKRVTVKKKLELKLEFVVPSMGRKELKCYLMCDSYVGVDQDPSFEVDVKEGEESGEDEDEEMEG